MEPLRVQKIRLRSFADPPALRIRSAERSKSSIAETQRQPMGDVELSDVELSDVELSDVELSNGGWNFQIVLLLELSDCAFIGTFRSCF
jgi:hypothetical protein